MSVVSSRQPLRRAMSIVSASAALPTDFRLAVKRDCAMIPRMTRRHAQKLLLAAAALVCVFAAGDQAAAETAAPRRVVSFNICADQLVVALADPAQIAGLSPHATDPTLSAVADEARAFRRIQWHARSTIRSSPIWCWLARATAR